MEFEDYARHDAVGLAELVRRKEVSAAELADAALARMDEVNPRINAVVHRFDDIRIRSQRGWFGKTRFHWRMMVLACASNVGSNLSGIAGAVVFDSLASRRCAFDLDY